MNASTDFAPVDFTPHGELTTTVQEAEYVKDDSYQADESWEVGTNSDDSEQTVAVAPVRKKRHRRTAAELEAAGIVPKARKLREPKEEIDWGGLTLQELIAKGFSTAQIAKQIEKLAESKVSLSSAEIYHVFLLAAGPIRNAHPDLQWKLTKEVMQKLTEEFRPKRNRKPKEE
jgi:hypothetical protein